jgi:hypothetical protein
MPMIMEDRDGVLAAAYAPEPGPTGTGLTAVFVQPDGVVTEIVHAPKPGPGLTARVQSLGTG